MVNVEKKKQPVPSWAPFWSAVQTYTTVSAVLIVTLKNRGNPGTAEKHRVELKFFMMCWECQACKYQGLGMPC